MFYKKLKEEIGTANSVYKRDVPADVPSLEMLFNSTGSNPPNPRAVQSCVCASTEGAGGNEVSTTIRSTSVLRGSTSP